MNAKRLLYFLMVVIALILLVRFASGCVQPTDTSKVVTTKDTGVTLDAKWTYSAIQEFTYEGCEYIYFPLGNATWGTHKGNCKNPIHLYRIEK